MTRLRNRHAFRRDLTELLQQEDTQTAILVLIRATELELDLRLEAAGGDELGEVMGRDGYMRAPKVIWEGVGKRVLTLEWAEGEPLSSLGALDQPGLDREALADRFLWMAPLRLTGRSVAA